LDHKFFKNDFQDVHTVNAPENLDKEEPEDQHFIYCEILPPGHHQFIIYDPQVDEFYTHDFILGMNSKEMFTDFPKKKGKTRRAANNMWSNWREDTE